MCSRFWQFVVVVVVVSVASAAGDDKGGSAGAVLVFLRVTCSSAKRNPFLFCLVTNFSSNLVPLGYRKANLCIDRHLQIIKSV
jgi:hypothetical protein